MKVVACCLSSRDMAYLWDKILRVTVKPWRTRYSQVWTWEERSTNSGCCSAQKISGVHTNAGGVHTNKVWILGNRELRMVQTILEICLSRVCAKDLPFQAVLIPDAKAAVEKEWKEVVRRHIKQNKESPFFWNYEGSTHPMSRLQEDAKKELPRTGNANVLDRPVQCEHSKRRKKGLQKERQLGMDNSQGRWTMFVMTPPAVSAPIEVQEQQAQQTVWALRQVRGPPNQPGTCQRSRATSVELHRERKEAEREAAPGTTPMSPRKARDTQSHRREREGRQDDKTLESVHRTRAGPPAWTRRSGGKSGSGSGLESLHMERLEALRWRRRRLSRARRLAPAATAGWATAAAVPARPCASRSAIDPRRKSSSGKGMKRGCNEAHKATTRKVHFDAFMDIR